MHYRTLEIKVVANFYMRTDGHDVTDFTVPATPYHTNIFYIIFFSSFLFSPFFSPTLPPSSLRSSKTAFKQGDLFVTVNKQLFSLTQTNMLANI